jgi:hypothetical protein
MCEALAYTSQSSGIFKPAVLAAQSAQGVALRVRRKKIRRTILAKACYLVAVFFCHDAIPILAHSGGTDANGCHAGSPPYHCHGAKQQTQSSSGTCHPDYEKVCVPFASDVDCAGGSGNGPAYVRGPVRIVGPDVYGFDWDGDGWACET